MKKFTHFLIYNNTIPLMFGILFLGAGATFAASPDAREAVVRSESRVASIDNSYLLSTSITDETVGISINSVTENNDMYFVEYQMTTIEVKDGAWQPVTKTKVFEVQKSTIVGQDLGLYVEGELAELHTFETKKLRDHQERERQAGVTPKVVATEYSGLVGQFLDPNTEVFPSYDPLIDPAIGIPLTSEQEAAHREARKQLDAAKEQELKEAINTVFEQPTTDGSTETPAENTGSPENQVPPTDAALSPAPEPTPVPAPEPAPQSAPEPLPSVDTLFPTTDGGL